MVTTLLQLTVRDILQRPLFRKAEAIASEEALNRIVRWVHIMEVTHVGHLLNGNELILSTGIAWHADEELCISFLQQLMDSGASGLCIELGTYTKKPFEAMKQLAQQHHFPLILFHEEVRYIDITQDLHSYFIHQHHRMVSELEALSTRLNQLLLSGKGMPALLRLLHETTQAQVAFFPLHAEAAFVPPLPKDQADGFYQKWIYGNLLQAAETKSRLAHRPILALDHLLADLLIHARQELSEFQILALDRCATAIAQEMMRTNYIEEKRRFQDDAWVIAWLNGKHTDPEIRDYLKTMKPAMKLNRASVCIFDWNQSKHPSGSRDRETLFIQKTMVARAIFEGEGFYLLPCVHQEQIVFVLLDQRPAPDGKARIMKAICRLQQTETHQEFPLFSSFVGIGKEVHRLPGIQESYETALETLRIQKDIGPLPAPFYSDLHCYKIISGLKKAGLLSSLIEEYIEPVAAYDRDKNGQLLKTLNVFLAQSGSKQDTAKELFVVRQTLYHRLDKLASLLGDDFMEPQKRLTIELALRAYEYTRGAIS
ncbi:PucR family transcriptional regulator [Paenibacillus rigui]|uniref:CdaR family transcriptional regulator n=1 Tax=Paenibacillus rigui TaxID=554312 RepID=A0A229UWD5_9BACL|nr:PucR family transcriptional regulator [Paenibacillus rigui]OXM87728.1 CdaR family transcriptional regulator [Paenibacillus rigui]